MRGEGASEGQWSQWQWRSYQINKHMQVCSDVCSSPSGWQVELKWNDHAMKDSHVKHGWTPVGLLASQIPISCLLILRPTTFLFQSPNFSLELRTPMSLLWCPCNCTSSLHHIVSFALRRFRVFSGTWDKIRHLNTSWIFWMWRNAVQNSNGLRPEYIQIAQVSSWQPEVHSL